MLTEYILELNKYGNVTDIPEAWKQTTLTVTQLKKLNIPYYKACIGFKESYRHYTPILVNIIPKDFAEQELAYLEQLQAKKEKRKKKYQETQLTEKVIAECLYSINKEAKRQRDIQNDFANSVWGHGSEKVAPHYRIHEAKRKKLQLYDLKDMVLMTVIQKNGLQPVGYHSFPDRPRDMYEFGGFQFHINQNISKNCLGSIDGFIPAERDRTTPPDKAVIILLEYLKQNNTDFWEKAVAKFPKAG